MRKRSEENDFISRELLRMLAMQPGWGAEEIVLWGEGCLRLVYELPRYLRALDLQVQMDRTGFAALFQKALMYLEDSLWLRYGVQPRVRVRSAKPLLAATITIPKVQGGLRLCVRACARMRSFRELPLAPVRRFLR